MEEIDDLLREELEELQQPQIVNNVLTPTDKPEDIMNLFDKMNELLLNELCKTPTTKHQQLLTATPMLNSDIDLTNLLIPNNKKNFCEIDELLQEELNELQNVESLNSEDSDNSYVQTKMLSSQQGRQIIVTKIKCNHCYKKMADYECIFKQCKSKNVCKSCYDKHPHSLVKIQ